MSYPRYQLARQFKSYVRTSGDLTPSPSTSWQNITTASDLTVDAQIGDTLEINLNGLVTPTNADLFCDVVSLVSGAPVNSCSRPGQVATTSPAPYGVPTWRCNQGSGAYNIGGYIHYVVVASDIDTNGRVTIRFRYANSSTSGSLTFYAGSNYTLYFTVKNLGPADDD